MQKFKIKKISNADALSLKTAYDNLGDDEGFCLNVAQVLNRHIQHLLRVAEWFSQQCDAPSCLRNSTAAGGLIQSITTPYIIRTLNPTSNLVSIVNAGWLLHHAWYGASALLPLGLS